MRTRLTQKQDRFALFLFEGLSQREAWIKAGYSSKYAPAIIDSNACRMEKTTKVQARLAELREKTESAAVMNVQERKERLTEIARARLTDFMELGQDGSWVNLGPEVPMTGAIQEIRSRTEYNDKGAKPTVYTTVKLHNPIQAIDLLNKIDKLYTEGSLIQNNIDRQVNVYVIDNETKDLLARVGERTRLDGYKNHQGIQIYSTGVDSGQETD